MRRNKVRRWARLLGLELLIASVAGCEINWGSVAGWLIDSLKVAGTILATPVPVWTLIFGIVASPVCLLAVFWVWSKIETDPEVATAPVRAMPTTMFIGGAEIHLNNTVSRRGQADITDVQVWCPDCKMNLANINPSVASVFGPPTCIGCHRRFESTPTTMDQVHVRIVGFLRVLGYVDRDKTGVIE